MSDAVSGWRDALRWSEGEDAFVREIRRREGAWGDAFAGALPAETVCALLELAGRALSVRAIREVVRLSDPDVIEEVQERTTTKVGRRQLRIRAGLAAALVVVCDHGCAPEALEAASGVWEALADAKMGMRWSEIAGIAAALPLHRPAVAERVLALLHHPRVRKPTMSALRSLFEHAVTHACLPLAREVLRVAKATGLPSATSSRESDRRIWFFEKRGCAAVWAISRATAPSDADVDAIVDWLASSDECGFERFAPRAIRLASLCLRHLKLDQRVFAAVWNRGADKLRLGEVLECIRNLSACRRGHDCFMSALVSRCPEDALSGFMRERAARKFPSLKSKWSPWLPLPGEGEWDCADGGVGGGRGEHTETVEEIVWNAAARVVTCSREMHLAHRMRAVFPWPGALGEGGLPFGEEAVRAACKARSLELTEFLIDEMGAPLASACFGLAAERHVPSLAARALAAGVVPPKHAASDALRAGAFSVAKLLLASPHEQEIGERDVAAAAREGDLELVEALTEKVISSVPSRRKRDARSRARGPVLVSAAVAAAGSASVLAVLLRGTQELRRKRWFTSAPRPDLVLSRLISRRGAEFEGVARCFAEAFPLHVHAHHARQAEECGRSDLARFISLRVLPRPDAEI